MRVIDSRTHTIIGLVVGAVLIVAPWLLMFADESDAATRSAVGVGVFIVVNELITTSPASPIKLVPMSIHLILDMVTGVFLALTPWFFGFADEDAYVWLPHVVVGVLVVGYALMTRADDPEVRGPRTPA